MLAAEIDRRNLLKTAGIAGITAITEVPVSPALAAMTRQHEIDGPASLAAWVRMRANGGAVITLASSKVAEGLEVVWQPEFSHQPAPVRGKAASSWAWREGAYDTARALLVSLAVRNWDVEAGDCRLQDSRIVHERSGRSISYLIWVDLAFTPASA